MRIRKHAQMTQTCCLPSQLPSPNTCPSGSPSTRVCELNRSPWDVMSFTLEAMIEDDVGGDDNGGQTSATVESIPSSKPEGKEISWSSSSSTVVVPVSGREKRNEEMKSKSRKEGSFICCNKTDGKGWKCKKEAKRGHSLCEHHLAQLKSYYTNNKSNNRSIFLYGEGRKSGGAPGGMANNIHRGKSSSKTSSSNYYYYTGFGPLWRKGRGEDKRRDTKVHYRPYSSTPLSLSSGDDDDDDDEDDDEDSDDDDSNFDKKRTRKPVKTRSLKSLL